MAAENKRVRPIGAPDAEPVIPLAAIVHRGFKLARCPMCGTEDAVIYVQLDDLRLFKCDNDCEFERAELDVMLNQWGEILDWIDRAPVIEAEGLAP